MSYEDNEDLLEGGFKLDDDEPLDEDTPPANLEDIEPEEDPEDRYH